MPRNPGAKKHQHNNRHENGLVGPGKRVTKQKSNGHLNGSAKGPSPIQPQSSAVPTDESATIPVIDQYPNSSSESRPDTPQRNSQPVVSTQDSDPSCNSATPDHAAKWEPANGTTMAAHRRSEQSISKSKAPQDVTAFQIASTILKSRPAYDTVALLIVLLALPSMVLTMVQALFASLTLMPGAGLSPISFLSLFDVFQGSAGSPSLGTMAVMDLVFFGLWICLWSWAQNFALDLAQIQIAITLGNGSAGKNSTVNTFCFVLVLLLHSIRSKGVRRFLVSNLLPANLLHQPRVAEILQYLPNDADFGESPGSPSKIRCLFALHILSQAFMAFVRRRVTSTSSSGTAKPSKRADTEASAGAGSMDSTSLDSAAATGTSSGVDYQAPPTPGFKDPKEKGLSAKKRRRQAHHVRSRQPFWAALASTKVHVLREVEHNKGLPNVANNQTSPFEQAQQDTVWVSEVDPSCIHFEANYTTSVEPDQESALSVDNKPFFIRINGARWHSVTLELLDEREGSPSSRAQWSGTISGLAPNCTYTCSFNRAEDDTEFASVLVKTPALLDKDMPQSTAPAPIRQPARPSSPTTTLKSSIASAEARLNDARNRLTKVKRQHKGALGRVEKEVESLSGRLKSSSDDAKQRQKLLQAERNTRLHEDAANNISTALENLDNIPEEESEHHFGRRQAYEEKSKLLEEANEALLKAKSAGDSEVSCVTAELNSVTTRKERLTGRQAKLTEQQDRITEANNKGLNEKERRAADSAAREADQQRREAELIRLISVYGNDLQDVQVRTNNSWREIEALEKQDLSQRQNLLLGSQPLTPEGELPGTRFPPQVARPFAFGSFQTLPNTTLSPDRSPFLAYAKTLPSDGRRPRSDTNRSGGALSNYSAEFEDADPIPPMPTAVEFDTDGRKGSGSSRGQNNGSPAGIIGGGLRSPQKGTHSPGHLPGSTTW